VSGPTNAFGGQPEIHSPRHWTRSALAILRATLAILRVGASHRAAIYGNFGWHGSCSARP
jgi:hypothetical protein